MPGRAIPCLVAAVAAVVAGCFDPHFDDPTCSAAGECPPGWVCLAGPTKVCVAENEIPDGAADAIPDAVGDAAISDAPVDSPPVDAAASSVEPDGAVSACVEPTWIPVLTNGGFDEGREPWLREPAGIESIFPSGPELPVLPEAGGWAAFLGGHDNRQQVLAQAVALPVGTTRVRFKAAKCLVTAEVEPRAFDTMTVDLVARSDDTTVLVSFAAWSNLDAVGACQWSYVDEVRDLPDAPPGAALRIFSRLDGRKVTTLYLDSLSVQAFACPPAP
jgi:hypothetical protein